MYKLYLISFFLSLVVLTEGSTAVWSISQPSKDKLYETTIECKKPPSIGSFQKCTFQIKSLGKSIENAKVFLDGGMPLHHHGLPTAPKVTWSDNDKTYVIEGLKFSMPGKWELRFYINDVESQVKDHSVFSLDIK